jgi:dihydrofolate reductase
VKLVLIAALSTNRVIGRNGKVPWHLPEDLQRFKRLTTGHTLLMGRKTFESIGKPLSGRRNVVLSSRPLANVETYSTLADALRAVQGEEQVYVIGGGTVFAQLIESADELRLTIIERHVEGDTYFPPYEHLVGSTYRLKHSLQREGYRFEDYERQVA